MDYEYIVIGSGPSGAMAAQTLAEAGKQVAMIDVGIQGKDYESILPEGDFETIRRADIGQHRYFLGDEFESVDWDEIKAGAQLTPARKHLVKNVEKTIPLISETFFPMESMAYGGLGSGWGLGAYVYSDAELKKAGLNVGKMRDAYQTISDRIGISAGSDDISPYVTGSLKNTQPPLKMDNSTEKLLAAYARKRRELNKRGVYLGHPSMAMLTKPLDGRMGTRYDDLDFYTDRDKAAYRPWITINELRTRHNFSYLGDLLALRFTENETEISLEVKDVQISELKIIKCRRLILAAGVLGSARIVLRSFKGRVDRLPILCNPYSYLPCVNIRMLGTPLSGKKTSMAQAFMIYDENGGGEDLVSVAVYTYRSLLLYKIIKEAPLNFADGLGIMRLLQSSLMIAGIHHPDAFSEKKYLKLLPKDDSFTGDALFARYELSDVEAQIIAHRERMLRGIFRKLGCYPIKRVQPGFGASIHYAGSLPFDRRDLPGTTYPDGRLNGTRNVFVADASGFTFLPAKGITLTLMANAHLIALEALHDG